MSTTSLKLPDDLKARAASAAKARGISTHAFMLEAVQQATTAAELRAEFVKDALHARDDFRKTGKAYDGDEVLSYINTKARGEKVNRPRLKSWRS